MILLTYFYIHLRIQCIELCFFILLKILCAFAPDCNLLLYIYYLLILACIQFYLYPSLRIFIFGTQKNNNKRSSFLQTIIFDYQNILLSKQFFYIKFPFILYIRYFAKFTEFSTCSDSSQEVNTLI